MDELTLHDDLELVAGDSWTIVGTLKNKDGSAFDLTTAAPAWTLRGPDGRVCGALLAEVELTKVQPPTGGQVIIAVPRSKTGDLEPGRYHDSVRVTAEDGVEADTMWVGAIAVHADPFQPDEEEA